MKKIKVLHITQSVTGGILEYIKLFFSNIDNSRFELELICPPYSIMREEVERLGFKVYVVDMKREINLINDYKSYVQIKKLLKEIKPDIIHTHSSKAGVIGRLASYNSGIPNIYNSHGWSFSMNVSESKKRFYAFIEKICAKYCNYIVNISEEEQKLALKYNICSENKMKVIFNGIDINKYNIDFDRNKILNKLNIPKDSYIVGMVGRLTKQKSPETFIEIALWLKDRIKNSHFILVGDGELRDDLEEMIAKLNIKDKVTITGWTNEVNKLISIFDIGILTSKWEGFGLVLAEYMAARKPIVATNIGGIPNVIQDKYNGELVDTNDINAFCDSIIKIKNNDGLRKTYIENGYRVVSENFTIDRVVQEHEKLYLKLLK